jgi:DNA segregation ATPase FtsK/SpoIIIE, S-DNA-T family
VRVHLTWEQTDLVADFPPTSTVGELRSLLPGHPEQVWIGDEPLQDEDEIGRIPNGSMLTPTRGPRCDVPTVEAGTFRFHRPPRITGPPEPPPPDAPVLLEAPKREIRFRWAMATVPLLAGLVLAAAFGPMMAVFSLVGVLMAVGGWAEDRIGVARERRRSEEQNRAALARYHRDKLVWRRKAAAIRRSCMPDPTEMLSRASSTSPALWQRRPSHSDFGMVSVGMTDGGAPLALVLLPGHTVGVAGEGADGVARWIVIQAVTHHGPADLSVKGPSSAIWEWLKWLPHPRSGTPLEVAIDEVGSDRICGVVVAPNASLLPGSCDVVVRTRPDGSVTLLRTSDGATRSGTLIEVSTEDASKAARHLSCLRDPDAAVVAPDARSLNELLGFPTPASIADAWRRSGSALRALLGVDAKGPLEIDLVADGPHGLLAGTTGSGKSELLRSLVASLAVRHPPRRIVFVLVDFKGGATFDPFRGLPHLAGSITDLDPTSAGRVLEALEAELRTREEMLRSAGVASLDADDPIVPHLLVVVDEFAALADQAPATLDGLVDLARRGRSLGMHVLLATQRPAGVVGERIRANTSIRIALRVHDRADSEDVIGAPDAARIERRHPGRGYLRLGPGELIGFQAGFVSGVSGTVRVASFHAGDPPEWRSPGGSDLDRLVEDIRRAAVDHGEAVARPLWRPPLPQSIRVRDLPSGNGVPVGLVDDPRSRRALLWTETNVLLVDPTGIDSGRALAGLATAVCSASPEVHVHIAHVRQKSPLWGLEELGQVGNVVGTGEQERTERLLRHIGDEIVRRRLGRRMVPTILLIVEDIGGGEQIERIVAEGPSVGVLTAASIAHVSAIGGALLAGFQERLAFRLVDPYEYLALGIGAVPAMPPGAAFSLSEQRVVRVVEPECVNSAAPSVPVPEIRALPAQVPLSTVEGGARHRSGTTSIPVGLGGVSIVRTIGLRLDRGRHVLITGPHGSGKSTALRAIETSASETVPVRALEDPEPIPTPQARVWLIDDAHAVDLDPVDIPPDVHLVAAARTGEVPHGHWVRRLVGDADGLVLCPDHRDEDLWRRRLAGTGIPGRGVLIDRRGVVPIQVASGTMTTPPKEDT